MRGESGLIGASTKKIIIIRIRLFGYEKKRFGRRGGSVDNKSEKRFVGGYKKEEVEEIEWYTKGDRQPVSIDTLFFFRLVAGRGGL